MILFARFKVLLLTITFCTNLLHCWQGRVNTSLGLGL